MGPSCNPPRVPSEVAGLEPTCLLLSLANDDFGRARLVAVGGRTPLPTLAEKKLGVVAADTLLEKFMLVRCVCDDGLREWLTNGAAGMVEVYDFGVGRIDLVGSATRSVGVFLFAAGSGTICL